MKNWNERLRYFVATAFGLGLAPIAPGTAGALLGVGIYLLIVLLSPPGWHTGLIALALLFVSYLTVAMTPWAEQHWKKKDPGNFVLDEVAGFLMTVLLFRTPNVLLTVIWAYLVTRIFDIVKPPPARQLESLPGGWGVLLDDLCTSVMAAAFLYLVAWLAPGWIGAA